ncbi:MAG: Fic family protein [Sphingomonadales bacterium]|jgi:ATP-dependent DNA helicase RecG
MPKETIFISSVQKEFANERQALAVYIREDELLKLFFEPYLFEEVAASGHTPGAIYLQQVKESAIYLGLLGKEYGFEDADGISPTEREFDAAQASHKACWVFIQGGNIQNRHPKETAFIEKVGERVSRKRFTTMEELKNELYRSCILYLKQTGKLDADNFDYALHRTATIDSLSDEYIAEFVRTARLKRNFPLKETDSKEIILSHLNLLRNGQLTNSALLVFAKNPQSFFPTATIKCAHFHGTMVTKPMPDYKEFGGTVFQMADDAIDFVLSKISLSTGDRSQSNLVDTAYEIPRQVIAEAVINAIAHRDYVSHASIQLSVFKDRIEIQNPGSLAKELDITRLNEPHSSYPYNPLLANCMFLTGAIERFGTGIPEMYALTAKNGLRLPDFEVDRSFTVTLWRPSATTDHDTDYDTDHDTDHDKKYIDITELPKRLLWIMKGEIGRNELMQILELKHNPTFRENYLDPAIKRGWIEMTIPDKPKSKKQKYRLTQLGKEEIEKIKNESK